MSSIDYKKKYLKYKGKYINLKNQAGNGPIPRVLPGTQSWFYMPIILLPFNDVIVRFPERFSGMLNEITTGRIRNIERLKEIMANFYRSKGINLEDRRTIQTIGGYRFDDASYLHLEGGEQERLLRDIRFEESIYPTLLPYEITYMLLFLETIIEYIVMNLGGDEIELRIK